LFESSHQMGGDGGQLCVEEAVNERVVNAKLA
jgi:hypothetical protein